MYLLDTDILSNLMKRSPSTNLLAKLATVPVELQFTSSVTLSELIYGAHRFPDRAQDLLQRIADRIMTNLPALPFDTAAAHRYGEVRAHLERSGISIGDADLRIASIALARNLVVVTGNVRHFQRVPGLSFENWLDS